MQCSVKVCLLSSIMLHALSLIAPDERQGHIDNDSEVTSLVQSPSFDAEYLRSTPRQTNNDHDGVNWFIRLFKRSGRGHYEEIGS